jgi:hypothetical protein
MNPRLKVMLFAVGTVALGGLSFALYTPQPATRTMLELRDAGIREGQAFILVCPEKITPQTRRRIREVQPNFLRPRQQVARVARVATCHPRDGGTQCWAPATWTPRVGNGEAEVIIPSLRQDLEGVDLDASVAEDAGEDAVDDSLQFNLGDCMHKRCATYDAGVAPGIPFGDTPCAVLNRVWAETPPCVLPNCWPSDGGPWDDKAGRVGHMPAPACYGIGPRGTADGGQRWNGCNTIPSEYATGPACLPVECAVVGGDNPPDVLWSR